MKLTFDDLRMEEGSYRWEKQFLSNGYPSHTHEFYEIFLLLDGRLLHHFNGRKTLLQSGALQFLHPEDEHGIELVSGDRPPTLYNCHIRSDELKKNWLFLTGGENYSIDDLTQSAIDLDGEEKDLLAQKMALAVKLGRQGGAEYPALCRIILQEVFYLLIRRSRIGDEFDKPQWLEDALREMRTPEALAAGLPRLRQLSARTGEHLCRTMRRCCGMTPVQWLTEARLELAVRLLENRSLPIDEVAYRSGFRNLSYFRRCFLRRFNVSPLRFRKTGSGGK